MAPILVLFVFWLALHGRLNSYAGFATSGPGLGGWFTGSASPGQPTIQPGTAPGSGGGGPSYPNPATQPVAPGAGAAYWGPILSNIWNGIKGGFSSPGPPVK